MSGRVNLLIVTAAILVSATRIVEAVPLSGPFDLGALGNGGATFQGLEAGDRAGFSVAPAGDFNNDGIEDFLISARQASPNSQDDSGETYLVYGQFGIAPWSGSISLDKIGGAVAGVRFQGAADDDRSGYSVQAAGDINGDGVGDLLIGAQRAEAPGLDDSGATYVVYGKGGTGAYSGTVDLGDVGGSVAGAVFVGVQDKDRAGSSVSAAGDVNGDGVDDLLIAAPSADPNGNSGSGEVYLVYGRSGVSAYSGQISLSTLGGDTPGALFAGEASNDAAGISVSAAGDVDGDGNADILVGANRAAPNGGSSGKAYLIYGQSGVDALSGNLDLSDVGGTIAGARFDGEALDDQAGISVSSAGDVNLDSHDDILIGALNSGGHGAAYLIYGGQGASLLTGTNDLSSVGATTLGAKFIGGAATDEAGRAVARVGDVDGDGFIDFLIGASSVSGAGGADAGAAYLIYGDANSSFTGSPSLGDVGGAIRGATFHGINQNDHVGQAVAGIGDVNGDGLIDLLIGASDVDNSSAGASSGEAYLVFGKRGTNVRWIHSGSGDWGDHLNWLGFESPTAVDDVTIDPADYLVVSGSIDSTTVRSLTVDNATLRLLGGTTFDAIDGVEVLAHGILTGGSLASPVEVVGDVDNAGLIDIGTNVGAWRIDGDYDQTGMLRIEIDSASQFDMMEVLGTASLGGSVEFVFNYLPTTDTQYTFLRAGEIIDSASFSVSGLVDAPNVWADIANGRLYYTVSDSAAAVPEPSTGSLFTMVAWLCLPCRRRKKSAPSFRQIGP